MALQLGEPAVARKRERRRERLASPLDDTNADDDGVKARVLLVEDDELVQESMGLVLESDGYTVSFAGNGFEALARLQAEPTPDLIVLDLRMPVMDGWQFRIIQRDDAKLGQIPVLAISADGTAQAAAISAQAYLRKPVTAQALLDTVERVLVEDRAAREAGIEKADRLAALGRLAAHVGHEINNPLTSVMLNLQHARERLKPSIDALEVRTRAASLAVVRESLKADLAEIAGMLVDCQMGSERIEEVASRLSSSPEVERRPAADDDGSDPSRSGTPDVRQGTLRR